VMDKVGYPRGLVRYDTQHGIEGKAKHVIRPRTVVYATLLAALTVGLVVSITHRNVVAVDVIRDRNALFRERPDGTIENVYDIKILNKDSAAHEFRITGTGLPGLVVDYAGPTVWVGPGDVQGVPVRIRIPGHELEGGSDIELTIQATDRPDLKASGKARFIAPSD
jgi:polyferredoxin